MTSWLEFRGALLTLGALMIFGLLAALIAPGLPGIMLVQSLQFHLAAAGLVLAVLLIVLGARWRAALFALALAVLIVPGALSLLRLHERRVDMTNPPVAELRVLSFNVLADNPQSDDAARFIVETAPDIAVVMETPGVERQLDAIGQVLPYRVGCEKPGSCDISIFSSRPIISGAMHPMAPFRRERLATAVVNIGGQTVTVVAVHLSKPHFDFISWQEIDQIRALVRTIEGPVIMAGDFNAAPWSESMTYLADGLDLVPPPWHPGTWPVEAGDFGVPIDNMFTRGGAQIMTIGSGADSHGSNHRYLLARVGIYGAS